MSLELLIMSEGKEGSRSGDRAGNERSPRDQSCNNLSNKAKLCWVMTQGIKEITMPPHRHKHRMEQTSKPGRAHRSEHKNPEYVPQMPPAVGCAQ